MINTTHYNLQKAEANDIVNSLLPANTNMDKIDTAMFDNLNSGVHNASHTKTGTVHALVRTVTTANFFKFSATDDFRTGDTFTLDGEVITARTQAYAGLPDYAFRTGSEVIAITDHGVLTIYCAGDNITVDDALSPTSENPVQNKVIDGALSAIEDDVTAIANKVGNAPLQTDSKNCSGAINELNTQLANLNNKADKSYVEANELGSPTTIGTSVVEVPSDGFIEVNNDSAYIYGHSSNNRTSLSALGATTYASCFVRKGMRVQRVSTTGTLRFFPLS